MNLRACMRDDADALARFYYPTWDAQIQDEVHQPRILARVPSLILGYFISSSGPRKT